MTNPRSTPARPRPGSGGREGRGRGGDLERGPLDLQVDDGGDGVRGDVDVVGAVEDGAHGSDVVLEGGEDRRGAPEDVYALGRSDGEHRGKRSREDEGRAVDALGVISRRK